MNFINDLGKFNKIKQLAGQGNEKAKDFLFNFMDMSDEEANKFLSSLDVKEKEEMEAPKEETQDWKAVVQALIDDENEAIDGYDKAIKFVSNSDLPKLIKTAYLEKLEHIKSEELEHIEELKEIL